MTHSKLGNQNKAFLEEASALIELVNLVDRFRLKHKKPNKRSYECKGKRNNESRSHRQGATREHRETSGHSRKQASRRSPKLTVQYKAKNNNRSSRKNSKVIRCTTKSGSVFHSCPTQSKRSHKRQVNNLQPKIDKDFEKMKAKLLTLQHYNSIGKLCKDNQTAKSERQRKLVYDLDKMNYVQIYSLKDFVRLHKQGKLGRTPTLLPKADHSKIELKTGNIDNFLSLNKESLKGNNKKRVKEKKDSAEYVKKEKQSLHLTLNLRIKSDSKNINLEVTAKKKTRKSYKHGPSALDFCMSKQCNSTSAQEQINRLLINILTRKLSKSSTEELTPRPLVNILNKDKFHFMQQQDRLINPKSRDVPRTETQAVYNVYDISTPQFGNPKGGEMRVYKSNVHFNLNVGKGPKYEQTMSTGDGYTPSGRPVGKEIRYKSKVGFNNGTTSLQQSFSVGRKQQPQPEEYVSEPSLPCDCEPFECDSGLSDLEHTGTSTCPTCCQEPAYIPPEKFNYITTLKRAKQRIMDRVANVRDDASVIINTPRTFFKNIYNEKRATKSKNEPAQKDAGSCTCYPFIDTEQVSVLERDVRPDCSFLQRIFGDLLFNDKCVVCNKQTEISKKHKFACGPGVCVESKGLSPCISKWFEKCKSKCCKKKKKKKKKKQGSCLCRFMCRIFCGITDKEREKLLKKKAKNDREDKKKRGADPKLEKGSKYLNTGRRQFRRVTRRIRERYYRNKKLAEQQKGQFACDFYLMSLRNKPCLWVYYMCPFCYPYCLQGLSIWRQVSDLMLFFVAIIVWSPCILAAELLKVMACNMIA